VEDFTDFVEKELGRSKDLGRRIHGATNRESTTVLIPIVSDHTKLFTDNSSRNGLKYTTSGEGRLEISRAI
jgi:hypothetical protein